MNTTFSSFTKALGKVSVVNSVRELTLASGESFIGNFEQVALYAEISVLVVIDGAESATLSLVSSIDRQGTNALTRTVVVTGPTQHIVLPVSAYFRIELDADQGTAATGAIQTIYHKNKSKPQTVSAIETITDNTDVEVVRAIMVGQDPTTGDYINISTTNSSGTTGISANLNSPLDAFGRLQVSNPISLFTSKQQTNDDPEQLETLTSGTGTTSYTAPFPHTNMQVLASGDRVIRQSRQYSPYQPGKSMNFILTGTLLDDASIENVRARIGPFDDLNDKTLDTNPTGDGFFFELIGGVSPVLNLVHRTSNTESIPPGAVTQVDTTIPQTSWNIDTLDGSGLSGYTIDPTQRQIYAFLLEWLGTGDVLCGIYTNNKFLPCHRFSFTNGTVGTETEVAYATRASLPVRYELEAIGVPTSTATMRQICSSVSSDGGFNPEGIIYAVGREDNTITTGTAELPVLSLRLNQTGTADIRPRVILNVLKTDFIVTGSGDSIFNIYLFRNPGQFGAGPLTAPSFVNSSAAGKAGASISGSAAEYDISATGVDLTGATYPFRRIEQGFFSKEASSIEANLKDRIVTLVSDIAGNSDLLVITMLTFAGNQTASCSIQWQEYE